MYSILVDSDDYTKYSIDKLSKNLENLKKEINRINKIKSKALRIREYKSLNFYLKKYMNEPTVKRKILKDIEKIHEHCKDNNKYENDYIKKCDNLKDLYTEQFERIENEILLLNNTLKVNKDINN